MRFIVNFTQAALNDLFVINKYFLEQASNEVAADILNNLQSIIQSLEPFREREPTPRELLITGIKRYRQVVCAVFRIFYRIQGNEVFVVMVIDGRSDIADALLRRQSI